MPRTRVVAAISVVFALVLAGLQAVHSIGAAAYRDALPICRVATSERLIALTFDDGPSPEHTDQVLALLERTHATATFFMIGSRARAHPELVRTVAASGSELGDHTWSHPHLDRLSETAALDEISRTRTLLTRLADVRFERMPYGEARAETFSDAIASGLTPVHWSIPLDHYVDGLALSPRAAADAIERDVEPGDIVLAHDADDGAVSRGPAIATLALVLPELEARGYRFVSVGELLDAGAPVRATRRPWFWQSGFTCPSE